MCGFIAAINSEVNVEELLDDIAYRGLPDYKGYKRIGNAQYGHVSLPFVNLDPEVAIQPRKSPSPFLFVGEIFNYKELGYDTDIECVHDLFNKGYGLTTGLQENFPKFDGFWTYVTNVNGSLLGVTDHLSIKPLYYRTDVEAMASEPDVLKKFGPVTPDHLFLSNVAKWGYDPLGGTPWEQIRQVPPGCYVYKGKVEKYWDWDLVPTTNLRDDLITATQLRLGGQREVSLLLSGGLDSTILYKILKKELGIDHVTLIHVDNNEDKWAKIAYQLGDDLLFVKLDDVTDVEALKIHQSPVDLGSVKPQIAMARKLKELGFHAVMTGDGADELFGGYRRAKDYDSQASDVWCELPYYHLPKLDRTMMESTIELRAPFLSPSVIKHALALPYDMRNGDKKELKKTFGDLVPEEILNRDKTPLKTKEIRIDPMKQRLYNLKLWKGLWEE